MDASAASQAAWLLAPIKREQSAAPASA